METWGELVRNSPALASCVALLWFGSGMTDPADVVPVGLQVWLSYAGPIMKLAGGFGLISILPYTIYRMYKGKDTSP